jgi:tetratricopeptide (TPR) repeat protein
MGKTAEAIEALEKAIELNPDIVQAWNNLANAYLQKEDVEKAIETGERLVKMAPDFGLGLNNLAFAYYSKGDYENAVTHVDKALALGFEVHPEFLKRLEPYRKK